jgi:hypothetical protein
MTIAMRNFSVALLAILACLSFWTCQAEPQVSVSKVWDVAPHNAFTDLIEFKGSFYLCFRESDQHDLGRDGTIRILKSDDAITWTSQALIQKPGVDLRDPMLSITPDGRLMLNLGGLFFEGDRYLGSSPHVSFSSDGSNWSEVQNLDMPNEWIWRVTWQKNIGYGVSYSRLSPTDLSQPWILTLFQTNDGVEYTPVATLDVPDHPSEVTLRFLPDDTVIALVRRMGNGWIGTSEPPYTTWNWSDSGTRLGGPNFLILPNGEMWAGSRLIQIKDQEIEAFTAIGPMTLTSYQPSIILPSGGDTSYPGMVYRDGILYVSYYSSHEGKANIYLAKVRLTED